MNRFGRILFAMSRINCTSTASRTHRWGRCGGDTRHGEGETMDAPDEAGPEQGAVGGPSYPPGLRGDLSRLFSAQGTHAGRPTMFEAVERAVTRPGPLAIVLYRGSHRL